MIKIITSLLALFIIFSGCSKKNIGEVEFAFIWKEYLKREFEEGFDERQSKAQREKILEGLLSQYDLELEPFKLYMKESEKEKYKKIFID